MTRVSDIMSTTLVTVEPSTTVREVARILVREGISGVPVVDGDDQVVGVVSGSDIVRAAARDPEVEMAFEVGRSGGSAGSDDEPAPYYGGEALPPWVHPVLVGDSLDDLDAASIMTPATFFVRPSLTISEFAEFLVRGRIHRALVLDQGRLVGIATSFDALKALAGVEDTAA